MADEEKEEAGQEATNSAESAKQWLDSDEGKAWFQSTLDRTIAKALKTHDEKRAPEIEKRVEAEREKARQEANMSAEEKMKAQIDEIQSKLSSAEQKAAKNERDSTLLKYAVEKKVSDRLIADILANPGATVETGKASIDAIAEGLEEIRKQTVNEALVNGSHKPGSGSVGDETSKLPGDPNDMSMSNRKQWEAAIEKKLEAS